MLREAELSADARRELLPCAVPATGQADAPEDAAGFLSRRALNPCPGQPLPASLKSVFCCLRLLPCSGTLSGGSSQVFVQPIGEPVWRRKICQSCRASTLAVTSCPFEAVQSCPCLPVRALTCAMLPGIALLRTTRSSSFARWRACGERQRARVHASSAQYAGESSGGRFC